MGVVLVVGGHLAGCPVDALHSGSKRSYPDVLVGRLDNGPNVVVGNAALASRLAHAREASVGIAHQSAAVGAEPQRAVACAKARHDDVRRQSVACGREGLGLARGGLVAYDAVLVGAKPIVAVMVFHCSVDAAKHGIVHILRVDHHLVHSARVGTYPYLSVVGAVEPHERKVRQARLVALVVAVVVYLALLVVHHIQAVVVGGHHHVSVGILQHVPHYHIVVNP